MLNLSEKSRERLSKLILDPDLSKGHHTDELREIIMVQKSRDARRRSSGSPALAAQLQKPYTPSPRTDGEVHANGILIGYARVSTLDQNPAMQRDALNDEGCAKLFVEEMSGAIYNCPVLKEMIEFARACDTIVVWKLAVTPEISSR